MTEGWICPKCQRGVAPGVKHCDHGEGHRDASPEWPFRFDHPGDVRWGPTVCDSCRKGGMCNCVLGRPPITCCTVSARVADDDTMLINGQPVQWAHTGEGWGGAPC